MMLGSSSSPSQNQLDQPIDLSNLMVLLQHLDVGIIECQSQIELSLDAATPDSQRYTNAMETLSNDIHIINNDIDGLQNAIKKPQESLEKLNALGVDIAAAEHGLELLKSVCEVLNAILTIKQHLVQFDLSLEERNFDISADALSQATLLSAKIKDRVRKDLKSVKERSIEGVGDETFEENGILCNIINDQIIRRREQLKTILSELVNNLFLFSPHSVQVMTDPSTTEPLDPHHRQSNHITLEQLWHALKATGCLRSELLAIATSLQHAIISPLIIASQTVPEGRTLAANIISPVTSGSSSSTNKTWSWFEANDKTKDNEVVNLTGITRSMDLLLNVLEDLFRFIAEYFFPGHPEALELLGTLLWNDITQRIIKQLENERVEQHILTKLKDFETQLRGLHVIPFDTSTLSTFGNRYEQLQFESKQFQMMSRVRVLCASADPAVVQVGTKTADDTLLKCLNQIVNLSPSDSLEDLCSRLRESPLSLPHCYVSCGAYEIVDMIDKLLEDVFVKIADHGIENNLFDSAVACIQKVVELFILLRSSLHRSRLLKDPMFGAVFYTDSLYISRRMLLLLASIGKQIPSCIQPIQPKLTLVHLICRLRSVEEQVFGAMLAYQRQEVLTLCQNFGNLSCLALDRHYTDVEGHIGEVVRFLKGLATLWSDALPNCVSSKCLGRLIDTFINCLLNEICAQVPEHSLSSDDKTALAYLLSSVRDQLYPIVDILSSRYSENDNNDVSVKETQSVTITRHSTLWYTLSLFRDLLQADVLEFVARKREINDYLTIQQVQTILMINERKTKSNHEILELLAS